MKVLRSQTASEDPGAAALQGVMLVPGAQVPLLALELPSGLRGQAREQVALRQLRDQAGLSSETTEIRPFAAPGEGEAWRRVLVAEAAAMSAWRNRAPADCIAVLPDYLGLPAAPDIWVLAHDRDTIRARLGLVDGFSAEPALAPSLLEAALEEGPEPSPAAVYCPDPLPPDVVALLEARDLAPVTSFAALAERGLAVPRYLAHGEVAADLRADPRAARARLRRQVLPWRWPLLLGLVAAGLWAAAQIIETQRLDAAMAAQRAEATRLARAHFIPTGPILDLRSQITQALSARAAATAAWRGRVAPLQLLGQAADVIAAERAAPEALVYDQNGAVSATVRVADFAAVDRLAGALRAAGLTVEVAEAQASGGNQGVRADLRISPDRAEGRP